MTERDFARELYPFLYPPTPASDGDTALLQSVRESTLDKCAQVIALRREMLAEHELLLEQTAVHMASCFAQGGKVLAFGNGGSATDADDAASDCLVPPLSHWRALPAISLSSDSATMSALTNDVGHDAVYVRQIGALGARRDIALGFSTSGNSSNVLAAFAAAKRKGMYTVAFTGYDGGELQRAGTVSACFVARREFVPRIQEGHATLWHVLLEQVQQTLSAVPEGAPI